MKKLIREIVDFDKNYLKEKVEEGKNIKFSAKFMTADSKNKNNRRYPFEILNTAIKEFASKVDAGKGYGANLHPATGKVEIEDISHRITKVFMRDKVAHIEGEILPGEKGNKILQIVKSGGVLGVSARGFGEMKKAKDGVNEIQKGYFLGGIDFIVNPSENVATINKSNIFESAPVEIEEEQFFSLQKNLEMAVREKAGKRSYIVDFSDKEVIYRVYTDGSEVGAEGEDVYFKIEYKISSEKIELVGEPEKVERKTTYEMTEDDLYSLYMNEYRFSGGRKSFAEYKESIGKNNE